MANIEPKASENPADKMYTLPWKNSALEKKYELCAVDSGYINSYRYSDYYPVILLLFYLANVLSMNQCKRLGKKILVFYCKIYLVFEIPVINVTEVYNFFYYF